MRPDAVSWRNTNQLTAIEFKPRHLIYRKFLHWLVGIITLQTLTGLAILYAMQEYPVLQQSFGAEAPVAVISPAGFPGTAPADPRQPLPASPQRWRDMSQMVIAQLGAFLVVMLIVVPLIRSTLRKHALGLEGLFRGIRDMAAGMVPKPLPAGRPGEVGYLALAFNDMTSRLLASRRELQEANSVLERRVEERTSELREAVAKLDRMASTDPLTGLANRRALIDQGPGRFESAVKRGGDLVCFVVDLDNLKAVNDTFGHKRGDELICLAADVLREGCRDEDFIARLGGDEFIWVVSSVDDIAAAAPLAERLQERFAQRVGELLGGCGLAKLPSMSIGITSRKTARAGTFEELVMRADGALYRAKELGKARAEFYAVQEAA